MFKSKKQEIVEYYAGLKTHELLDRFFNGNITDDARRVAMAEFAKRGIDPSDPLVLAKAEAEAQKDAYSRKKPKLTEEDISRQETGKLIITLLLIGVIPILSWLAGYMTESALGQQFVRAVGRQLGADGIGKIQSQSMSLGTYCASGDTAGEAICAALRHVSWLQSASIATLAVGIVLLLAIIIASRMASNNRGLLLSVFSPFRVGMLFVLFLLILAQGALAGYGAYIFETTVMHRIHYIVVGSIVVGAFIGAFSMLEAGLSISGNLSTPVIGLPASKEQQPRLWARVEEIARKLGATMPSNIVLGMEPNFFVTAAGVDAYPGPKKQSGATLYLSLPLMRILTVPELTAVVGHELGHYRGQDTEFSLRFYPIYAGTAQALRALDSDGEGKTRDFGFKSIGLVPATALLSFFMGQFAKAERKIGRERELEADRAGASASSPEDLATSLIKVSAFAPAWVAIRSAMVDALLEQKAYGNISSMFHEIVVANATPDAFKSVGASVAVHPTDTHPPTEARITSLGHSLGDFDPDALTPGASILDSSASLIDDLAALEEELTTYEHQALARTGKSADK